VPSSPNEIPIGSFVLERGVRHQTEAIRVVVGHRRDGRCITVFADAPQEYRPLHSIAPEDLVALTAVGGALTPDMIGPGLSTYLKAV
jgi:hypothetical protein